MQRPSTKELLEELAEFAENFNSADEEAASQSGAAANVDPSSDTEGEPNSEDGDDSSVDFETAMTAMVVAGGLYEIAGGALANPIASMVACESNPSLIANLIAAYGKMDTEITSLDALIQRHANNLTEESRARVACDAQEARKLVDAASPHLREMETNVSVDDDDDMSFVPFLDAKRTAEDCDKLQTNLHRCRSLVRHVHSVISTEAIPSGPAGTLAQQASLIADRIVTNPEYDVFVSHAGEDKHTMAIPLWEKLRDRGIKAFVDVKDLQIGVDAQDSMKDAMATAPVGVFIMSPEFAAKKWTMLELLTFQARVSKARKTKEKEPRLIPVFYRLGVYDWIDANLPWRRNSAGQTIFMKGGFARMARSGETSQKEVMDSLAELSKQMGIENSNGATNEASMAKKRHVLLDEVVSKIEEALIRSRSAVAPTCVKEATTGVATTPTITHRASPVESILHAVKVMFVLFPWVALIAYLLKTRSIF